MPKAVVVKTGSYGAVEDYLSRAAALIGLAAGELRRAENGAKAARVLTGAQVKLRRAATAANEGDTATMLEALMTWGYRP